MMTYLRFALALALTGSGACSAALKWDPDGLACDPTVVDGMTDFCLGGYSCETQSLRCVRDGSLAPLAVCSQSRQCKSGDVCPADLLAGGGVAGSEGIASCAPGCNTTVGSDPYYTAAGCNAGYVCTPFLDSSATNPNKGLVGACQRSSGCTAGSSCSTASVAAGICVDLGASNTACLPSCEITWAAAVADRTTSPYSDNCDSLHSCQSVGVAGGQQLVCGYDGTDSTSNPLASIEGQHVQPTGAACSWLEAPCAAGDVCAPTGVCANFCPLTDNLNLCPTPQLCCQFTTFAVSPKDTGYCSDSCK